MNRNRKVIVSILVMIIAIGTIVFALKGLNYSFVNSGTTRVVVRLQSSFDKKDIETIAKEVYGDNIMVQVTGDFQDGVVIIAKDNTDEKFITLLGKLNEKYNETEAFGTTAISINLDGVVEKADVEAMAREVYGEQLIQVAGNFESDATIVTRGSTTEQFELMQSKLKEKYFAAEETDIDTKVTKANGKVSLLESPKENIVDTLKNYGMPLLITSIIMLVYILIVYHKKDLKKALGLYVVTMLLVQTFIFAVYAITRIPVSEFLLPTMILGYVLANICVFRNLDELKDRED